MGTDWVGILIAGSLAAALVGCSHLSEGPAKPAIKKPSRAQLALDDVKAQYAPDSHLAIFSVGIQHRTGTLVLTGEVDRAEAKLAAAQALERTGARVENNLTVLPSAQLGEKTWGISCLSVASAREQPEHKAEMGTQILMGDVVQLWKQTTNAYFTWYLAQSRDGYLAWLEKGTFVRCTREQVEAWNRGPLLFVTAFEDSILEQPRTGAQPVSDVVPGDLVRKLGEAGQWFKVQLPDERVGFLPKRSAEDYVTWRQSRQPTPENIELTARKLIGRPYLWGANSPKGLDCSGFTKLVFLLNGIELKRNASHQARQGVDVPLDPGLSQLRKGDLLFFGHRARPDSPERVTHVGIYLGDKLFIHSAETVHLSSLDPNSPLRDEHRIRGLIRARRILQCQ